MLVMIAYAIGYFFNSVASLVTGPISLLLFRAVSRVLIGLGPWRDRQWQVLARALVGEQLCPGDDADREWHQLYLVVKAYYPQLDNHGMRMDSNVFPALLAAACVFFVWNLNGIRPVSTVASGLTVIGLLVLTVIVQLCTLLMHEGVLATDISGADLKAAMLRDIRSAATQSGKAVAAGTGK
jgi:amino acid transporter